MNAHVDELRALEREMRTISMVAGQCSVEGAEDAISLLAAAEAERTSRWAGRLQAVARELERLTIARAAPPGADYVSLLHEANRRVEASPLHRRFIAHTPLSNDVAVWMADLAHEAHDAGARAAEARTLRALRRGDREQPAHADRDRSRAAAELRRVVSRAGQHAGEPPSREAGEQMKELEDVACAVAAFKASVQVLADDARPALYRDALIKAAEVMEAQQEAMLQLLRYALPQ